MMGWNVLPIGLEYYNISEELDGFIAELLSFLFNFSFGWYLLITFVFFAGVMFMGFRLFIKSTDNLYGGLK